MLMSKESPILAFRRLAQQYNAVVEQPDVDYDSVEGRAEVQSSLNEKRAEMLPLLDDLEAAMGQVLSPAKADRIINRIHRALSGRDEEGYAVDENGNRIADGGCGANTGRRAGVINLWEPHLQIPVDIVIRLGELGRKHQELLDVGTDADRVRLVTLQEAIVKHGTKANPDTIIAAAKVARKKGRQLLRLLEARGEYRGFARSTPSRYRE